MKSTIAQLAIAVSDSWALSLVLKATVITAVALISVRLTRRNAASVRHLLLTAVLSALIGLPFAGVFVPSIPITVAHSASPVSSTLLDRVADAVAANSINAAIAGPRSMAGGAKSIPLSTIIASFWTAGMIVFLLPMIAGLWELRRIRRFSIPWLHGQTAAQRLSVAVEVKGQVDVVLHNDVSGPITFGILHPVIVFPPDVKRWSDAELERAVLHELEHVRRADCFTHGLARLVCAAYWFHPLVWMSWRQLGLEAERACDDVVLRRAEATEYADQLVTLAKRIKADTRRPLLAMANRSDLSVRIASLLDAKQRRGRPGPAWIVAAMTAAALLVTGIAPLRAVSTVQQGVEPRLEFEVASVKPNESQRPGFNTDISHGTLTATNVTLIQLIQMAYRTQKQRVFNGPPWLTSDRFDVLAKGKTDATKEEISLMLRSLLADRFRLKVHNETRELPIYELGVTKGGSKMVPNGLVECRQAETENPNPPKSALLGCGSPAVLGDFQRGVITGSAITVGQLVSSLASYYLDRPVVDRTNVTGTYNISVAWSEPGGARPVPPPEERNRSNNDGYPQTSLFTSLEEQLGLRLTSTKGSVEVMVIDHLEKPSSN